MIEALASEVSGEAGRINVQVDVEPIRPAVWAETIGAFRDANVYQTRAYGDIVGRRAEIQHLVVRLKGRVVAAAQVRVVRTPLIPLGIAHVLWGPLWRRVGEEDCPSDFGLALRALHDEFVRRRGLLLRIVPNVEDGDSTCAQICDSLRRHGLRRASNVPAYRTFRLDLGETLDDLRRNLEHKWRNQLSRAERNGLDIEEGESAELYGTFLSLYDEMVARKRFLTSVDAGAFGRMQALLQDRERLRVLICRKAGLPLAGLVASKMGSTGLYLLGATSNEGMMHKGSYLLQWRLLQWLKEVGAKAYDLGGIDPEANPGVYHFKKGLSGAETRLLGTFEAVRNHTSASVVRSAEVAQRIFREYRSRLVQAYASVSRAEAPGGDQ